MVAIIGVTHFPYYSRLTSGPRDSWPPIIEEMVQHNELMAEKLAATQPDVLVMIAHDHLNQFFMNNMPAFVLGKMPRFEGTFNHEHDNYGLPRMEMHGDEEFAGQLLEGGLENGIDFAYSAELKLDHSVTVPLMMVRPELDLPIVPIFSNCIAPPLPSARRFHQVGQILRQIVEGVPEDKRVAFIVSGHLSLEVGGPKQNQNDAPDLEWDARAASWIAEANIEEALAQCADLHKMLNHGNLAHGFLNYLLALGLAGDRKPSYAKVLPTWRGQSPYFVWDGAAL
ncbi:MAG: extradiol ring-cleavage dioxygenase [Chloroflexi bacterium]|nr:extradiol ring-cleavage dioxygenase [Chloroflexota bacterium]